MKSNDNQVLTSLTSFQQRIKDALAAQGRSSLVTIHDSQWLSPCEVGKAEDGEEIAWDFYKLPQALNFENVEKALELKLHEDIKTYFGSFYSENLAATNPDGDLELLQAWNQDDFERLQENLIGHVLMKRRLKQPVTLFIGVTDAEDIIITLDNESGEVWAEQVGCKPHKFLATSISEFIDSLEPKLDE